jgi:hypothetical protein
MSHDRFTSVWDALEDTPQEAENLRLRSALMMALKDHLTHAGLTQAQAAQQLVRIGTPQAAPGGRASSSSRTWRSSGGAGAAPRGRGEAPVGREGAPSGPGCVSVGAHACRRRDPLSRSDARVAMSLTDTVLSGVGERGFAGRPGPAPVERSPHPRS